MLIKGNSPGEIQSALDENTGDAIMQEGKGFKPTLAIVTLTNIANAEALQLIFDKAGIAIFGISTSKKFTGHGLESDDIIAMLLDMKPEHFSIVLNDYEGSSAYEAGLQAGKTGKHLFANPGFIISPIDFKISDDELIRGLTDAAGQDVSIMGGVAGNPYDGLGIVFTNALSTKRGLLALIIDQDKIVLNGFAVSGWKPVGTTKKITKSEGTWVYTIDNEPAMKVIQRFLGNEMVVSSGHESGIGNNGGNA